MTRLSGNQASYEPHFARAKQLLGDHYNDAAISGLTVNHKASEVAEIVDKLEAALAEADEGPRAYSIRESFIRQCLEDTLPEEE